MNNIIFVGKIIEKSKVKFDYYNKLKASMEITLIENNNLFRVKVLEKDIDKLLSNIHLQDDVLVFCHAEGKNRNIDYVLDFFELFV